MLYHNQKGTNLFKVIFVVFQTGNLANGGVESISQIVERCKTIQSTVITQIETPVNQRWRDTRAETKVWKIPYRIGSSFYQGSLGKKISYILSLLQTNWRMYCLVKSTKAPVVHCNDPNAVWHTAFGAKLAGAKVVFNIRAIKATHESYDRKWKVACWVSDQQLVLSHEMRQALIDRVGILPHRRSRVDSIYSIVDPTKFYPVDADRRQIIRNSLGIHSNTFALGYIATFVPIKAQLALIEQAALLLHQSIPNLKLYFVGDFEPATNPYAKQCLDAVKRLNLEDIVIFVGYTSEVAEWYKALDLLVLASHNEGLARCMIEGLACGTPMVSFDVCSAREILEGYRCGYVVPQGDYSAIVKAISELAHDQSQCQRLGNNGSRIAKELFKPDTITQQYETMYYALVGLSPAPVSTLQSQISSLVR
jgi:glycosyltransferase involved in cell wall biosynthesis